ncbi:hypothetical protein RQP46_011418 [Phenoliferia psychrophenolica]
MGFHTLLRSSADCRHHADLKDLTILQGRGSRIVDLTPKEAVEEPLRFELERLSIGTPNLPWLDGCPVLLISIFVTSAQTLTLLVLDYPDDHPILEHFLNLFLPLVKDNLRVLEFAGDFLPSIAECVVELGIGLTGLKAREVRDLHLIPLLDPTKGLPSTLETLTLPPYFLDTRNAYRKDKGKFIGRHCEVVDILNDSLSRTVRGQTLRKLVLTAVPTALENTPLMRSLTGTCKYNKIERIIELL